MRLSLLALAAWVIAASPLCAQTYEQYFDGTSGNPELVVQLDTSQSNIWQIGPPQKFKFYAPFSAPNVLVTDTLLPYPTNVHSAFHYSVSHEWSWSIAAIRWMQKLDMMPEHAFGKIEFSVDSINWINGFDSPYVYNFYGFEEENRVTMPDGQLAFGGRDTTWKEIWFCFDGTWLDYQDTLLMRYTFISDSIVPPPSQSGYDGWMIDNLIASPTSIHTVGETVQESYLAVSPNPATDRLYIQLQKINGLHYIESIQLFGGSGRIVQEHGMCPNKFYLDISSVPPGMYTLHVKSNLRTETQHVLISR